MIYNYFIPSNDNEALLWFKNFSSKLSTYAAKYGITAAQVTDMVNSYLFLFYWVDYRNQYSDYVKKLTNYKNDLRKGDTTRQALLPVPPTFGPAPTPVNAGIFIRAAAIANTIKSSILYAEADGKDLDIIGVNSDLNLVDVVPLITIRLVQGGHPEIVWKKNGYTSIQIEVDRGDAAGWVFLAIDTHPNYIDTHSLPPAGKSELWKYRAIYRFHDDVVGNYSDVASVTVGN